MNDMNRRCTLLILMLVACLLCPNLSAQKTPKAKTYLKAKDLPNAMLFLPPPPQDSTADFERDVRLHEQAKALRNTARGKRAIAEATTNVDTMAALFSGAFGMELSQEATPKTMHLLRRSIRTFRLSASGPKKAYLRKRPYVYYHEHTLIPGHELAETMSGSYPSGHTVRGWGMALVLSQLRPERQDTLLHAGYEWGQSRVIAGYHWQSDIDAARLLASACFARLQADPEFMKDLAAARRELQSSQRHLRNQRRKKTRP